jgi:hypothetical protein
VGTEAESMQIADLEDLKELFEDAAELLGLEVSVLSDYSQRFRNTPAGPSSLEKASDLKTLVRDLLVKTVGMGIDLP